MQKHISTGALKKKKHSLKFCECFQKMRLVESFLSNVTALPSEFSQNGIRLDCAYEKISKITYSFSNRHLLVYLCSQRKATTAIQYKILYK